MSVQPSLFAAAHAPSTAAVRAAQERLLRDRSLQFSFANAPKPPPPPPVPAWLKALLEFLSGATHLLGWVFWGGVALAAAALAFFIVREVLRARWPDRFKRKPKAAQPEADWRPEAGKARALLAEADRLAGEGAYAEAVHVLLYRSIEDIEERRPRLVRPALTARDIAALEGLPGAARQTFGLIAEVVERSFFGGRPVDEAGFLDCRRAYEAFAFPGAWA